MFRNDRSGVPMIWSASINAYVHWLPVTKLQFEYFLCDQPGNRFDQAWYDTILNVHEQNESGSSVDPVRVSPAMVQRDNYYRALLTGIRPSEIAPYISWLDEEQEGFYSLPTDEEWLKMYDELSQLPAIDIEQAFRDLTQTARVRILLSRMDAVARHLVANPGPGQPSATPPNCAEQMLMRNGVMEWVHWQDGKPHPPYGGRGKPFHRSLIGDVRDFTRNPQPANPGPGYDLGRFAGFGFRLVRRES